MCLATFNSEGELNPGNLNSSTSSVVPNLKSITDNILSLYRPDPTIKQRVSFIIATEGNSKCSPASGACIVSHKSL